MQMHTCLQAKTGFFGEENALIPTEKTNAFCAEKRGYRLILLFTSFVDYFKKKWKIIFKLCISKKLLWISRIFLSIGLCKPVHKN
jgi:hypothetical protein